MPATGHVHNMQPSAWSIPGGAFRPAVLFACMTGVCAKTEVVAPTKQSRKHPAYMTPEQFAALKDGKHWPEITGASG